MTQPDAQSQLQKTLTTDQAKELALVLLGYNPWLKLYREKDYIISIELTSIQPSISTGTWGIDIRFTLTDWPKLSTRSKPHQYELLIGYYDVNAQTNPGLIALSSIENGETYTNVLGNLGKATDLLRQWGVWDDHQAIINSFNHG